MSNFAEKWGGLWESLANRATRDEFLADLAAHDDALTAALREEREGRQADRDIQRAALDRDQEYINHQVDRIEELEAERDRLAAQVQAGEASDGHHTFDELYRYRMLYNAHAAHGWIAGGIPVVKSRRHADGEECFGGGWFIVTATLPTGQVSNHYAAEHWDLFAVPEVDLPPEWDGHTPADAARRLHEHLTTDTTTREPS